MEPNEKTRIFERLKDDENLAVASLMDASKQILKEWHTVGAVTPYMEGLFQYLGRAVHTAEKVIR